MEKLDFISSRNRFLDYVKKVLIGPGNASHGHVITGRLPSDVYPSGILFPLSQEAGIDPASVDDEVEEYEDGSSSSGQIADEVISVTKRRYVAPSSAGFSFFVSNDTELYITPRAVEYTNESEKEHMWQREALYDDSSCITISAPEGGGVVRENIWDWKGMPKAEIYTLWRKHDEGWIVTVSLSNKQQCREEGSIDQIRWDETRKSLYEVELECEVLQGEVYPYPIKSLSLMSKEEQELELQYRHKHIYAIGHGVAVDWDMEVPSPIIKIDFLPCVEVPVASPVVDEIDKNILLLKRLSEFSSNSKELIDDLNAFVRQYDKWQENQKAIHNSDYEKDEQKVSARIVGRMSIAVDRMKEGVLLLEHNKDVQYAFSLTNKAMLQAKDSDTFSWYPFQLGFILMALESVVFDDSKYRDTVDLIWFPTGGGKTEAYLGLIAFQIIYRRLTNSASYKGTSVIMRYTLRLLTQQQFSRATRLICALELLRREYKEDLKDEPITIGMWVGLATSPNKFDSAIEVLKKATDGQQPPRRLIVTDCPWCGETLWHSSNKHGYHPRPELKSIEYHCMNNVCDFFNIPLPINIIDEALYKTPPTLLFATVDKFARLAWDERAKSLLGGMDRKAPELIIQDELHLISSALGSIVGLYEAALDTVIQNNGSIPKYIASTATIRSAKEQVKALYGREHAVFPPPGLSSNDSFYTRVVSTKDKPGRMYVGFLASLMNKSDAFTSLSSALLSAPIAVFGDTVQEHEEFMDAWWTLLVYHGSLRGVGNSQNELLYHVPDRMEKQLENIIPLNWAKEHAYQYMSIKNRLSALTVVQLTSNKSSDENSESFLRLEKGIENSDVLDVALATNMISVGLDVGRLALMIINGQPLTTAEYIQSSSRVGRDDVPGIIFTNYYRHQSRSLSHYENFRPYHESFYRFVEPTSVTPYTRQARRRALHAALVIVIRHSNGLGMSSNSDAVKFDSTNSKINSAIENLRRRCKLALLNDDIQEQSINFDKHLDDLVSEWGERVDGCCEDGVIRKNLHYEAKDNDKSADRLLYKYDAKIKGLWHTLDSMRSVEDSALMQATNLYDPPYSSSNN